MRINTQTRRIDSTPVEGGKKCSRCNRVKPLKRFAWIKSTCRHHSWCKTCTGISVAMFRETPEGKAAVADYNSRHEVKAAKKAWGSRRRMTPEQKRRERERKASPRGKLINRRNEARARLRKATTDEQRARIQALIDRHTEELAALDALEEED